MSLGSYLGVRVLLQRYGLNDFVEAFQGNFLPIEMKRARADRFLRLKQNGRSVREYSLEFNSLARHAPTIVADMANRVYRYVLGLDLI